MSEGNNVLQKWWSGVTDHTGMFVLHTCYTSYEHFPKHTEILPLEQRFESVFRPVHIENQLAET